MIGAIIGDIVGSLYEFNPTNKYNFPMFTTEHNFTDDTICTVGVADTILNGSDDYMKYVHEWCRKYPYPMGGYGGSFARWVASAHPQPYYSYGNGAAMRVSPVAWLFDDKESVLREARKTAEITHNHHEGIKGAQTVALAIFCARQGLGVAKMIDECVAFSDYDLSFRLDDKRNVFDETCQGTVPVALKIIKESSDFEDAIRRAVSLGADADTLGAIVGSIAEAIWPIPKKMRDVALSYLPKDMLDVVKQFTKEMESRK